MPQAVAARDRADLMRAELEKKIPAAHGKPDPKVSPSPDQLPAEAAQVVAAYQAVIDGYGHTEIAAYAAERLSGFYQYFGHFDRAAEILEQTASEFAGTKMGTDALLSTGLLHLQARHDPAEAMRWFERIGEPQAGEDPPGTVYLAAQQQLIKCELELHRDEAAKARIEALKKFYPQHAVQLDRQFQFEIEAIRSRGGAEQSPTPRKSKPAGDTPAEPVAKAVLDRARHDDLVDRLSDAIEQAKEQKLTEDVRQRIEDVRKAGIDPAATLGQLYAEYGKGSFQPCTVILLALEDVGGPEGLDALKAIALNPGDGGSTLGPRAVKAMTVVTLNPEPISEVLESNSPPTRAAAAMALHGKKLTAACVGRLGELLRSDDWITHNLVTAAFATDRSTNTAAQKIDVLLAALPQLEHLKAAPPAKIGISSSPRDAALQAYIFALANMPGGEEILRAKLPEVVAGSESRRVLSLALAERGDKTVYPTVLEIAQKESSGMLRALAARELGTIGTARDIELLESLAADDPYTAISKSCEEADKVVYPVRSAAKEAVTKLRKAMPRPDASAE